MDRKTYTAELAGLRELRAGITAAEKQVAAARKELDRLAAQRSRRVAGLAGYEGAKADAIAKAAGLSVGDVVRIAPLLDPTPAAVRAAAPAPAPVAEVAEAEEAAEPAPVAEPPAAVAPALTRPAAVLEQPTPSPVAAPTVPAASVAAPVRPAVEAGPRELPTLPEGPAGSRFEAVTTGLLSKRPNFTQQARSTVFLDAAAGMLAVRDQTVRLDLGARTPGEILDAVLHAAPGTERVYITA
ncbi:hypothetical protein AMK13_33445, partial [Streptomyces sp. CB02056]